MSGAPARRVNPRRADQSAHDPIRIGLEANARPLDPMAGAVKDARCGPHAGRFFTSSRHPGLVRQHRTRDLSLEGGV